jgi:hypothetical protein
LRFLEGEGSRGLLAENPILSRLKELEHFGTGDIAEQIRGLVAKPRDDDGG